MKLYFVAALSIFALAPNAFAESVSVTVPGISINVPATNKTNAEGETTGISSGLSISITGSDNFSSEKIKYKCGDQDVVATYINAGDISLVQLDMADKTIVAANVLSGSGAKYAGEQYYWWEHQGDVSLYNIMEDPEQKKPVICHQQENGTGE